MQRKYEGCCSEGCQETIHLPVEGQKKRRKGIDKGRNINRWKVEAGAIDPETSGERHGRYITADSDIYPYFSRFNVCEETCRSHTAPLFIPQYFRLSVFISFPAARIKAIHERIFYSKSGS